MPPLKILVPTDFSPMSRAALEAAQLLARGSSGTVLAAHVAPADTLTSGFEDLIPSSELDGLSKRLAEACRSDTGVVVEHRLLHGPIAEAILDLVLSEQVDLIVMGTHGRHGLEKFLMGSVAEAVLRASPTPVLLVRGTLTRSGSDVGDGTLNSTKATARNR